MEPAFFAPLSGKFDFIMADPPWKFVTRSAKGLGKSADAHYATMSLDDIAALPVDHLAAPNALLWLWTTNPLLPQALRVMAAWGFTYKTAGAWVKRTANGRLGFGCGYLLRSASEPFLIGTRGSPKVTRATRTILEGRLREHSRKPDEAYAAAEALMPAARRADLFSRESRPGWESWGFEAGKFDASTETAPALETAPLSPGAFDLFDTFTIAAE